MSFTDYTTLQASVADWLHRSDLTSAIVDCIALAEERFNQRLRTRFQELALAETAIDASYQVAIPSNVIAVKRMWRTDSPKTNLKPQTLDFVIQQQAAGAQALYYAMEGSTWRFDGTGSVAGVLYRNIPALSDTSTNWLLTAYPSLYLHATLEFIGLHTRDVELMQTHGGLAAAKIEELNRVAQRDEFTGPLVARVG